MNKTKMADKIIRWLSASRKIVRLRLDKIRNRRRCSEFNKVQEPWAVTARYLWLSLRENGCRELELVSVTANEFIDFAHNTNKKKVANHLPFFSHFFSFTFTYSAFRSTTNIWLFFRIISPQNHLASYLVLWVCLHFNYKCRSVGAICLVLMSAFDESCKNLQGDLLRNCRAQARQW